LDSDISVAKRKIMVSLVENDDIVTALGADDIDDRYSLIYSHLYPYLRIPDAKTETGSYILVAISVPRVSKRNNNYKTMEVTICVVTHQDHMQTAYNANRNDLLAGIIVEEFNWSDILGFEMELVSDTESILNDTYHLREIKFNALAKNYMGCK